MKTTQRSQRTVEHAYREMRSSAKPIVEMDTEEPVDEMADDMYQDADAVIAAFMDEFQGDLIETMRLIAKAQPTEFEAQRDAMFSRIENLLRNQMIRGLTAQVLVGRGDDDYVA